MLRPAEPLGESPWIPGFVLAFGLASVILLLVSDRIRERSAIEDAYSLLDCEQIRVDLAISHLWLEEYVSGDTVEVAQIQRRLEAALEHLDQMAGALARQPSSDLELASPPLHDPALRRRAAALRPQVENFQTLSIERQQGFARHLPVGIGTPLEAEYDQAFNDLLSATEQLEMDLLNHHRRHREQTHRLFLTIVLLWSLLVALAALGLWVRQRRQKKAELDLLESQAQLTHSQRMDAAGRLAGGLAHDLSNYLAAIRGHCELTRLKLPLGEQLAGRMDEVIQSVDRASSLVDRLLAFGRRQPMHPTSVDPNRMLAELATMLTPSMGDRVRLEIRLDADLWPIQVDRTGLEQALVNLLVNARDAMPEGGDLWIEAHNRPADATHGDAVEVSVSDHGVGIPTEDLERIFDPFWTTKQSRGGSGLGLSLVYSFVEQSGGRLAVESLVGKGTTFKLFFPRCSEEARLSFPPSMKDSTTAHSSGSNETGSPQGEPNTGFDGDSLQEMADGELEGDETLLLVDDNEALRQSTQEVLQALGYRVLAAADGAQALALARQHAIDLYILDLVLPDLDGRLLQQKLMQQGDGQKAPTILISGHHPNDLDLKENPLGEENGEPIHFLSKRQLSAFRLAQQIRRRLDGPEAAL